MVGVNVKATDSTRVEALASLEGIFLGASVLVGFAVAFFAAGVFRFRYE